MELTIDQAIQKAVEAHKAGQVQEADRLYTAILKAQPKHPDANHNLGVLTVSVGKVEAAIPFFKKALEGNASIVQFWLSYIDALIKLRRLSDANAAFEDAKVKGAKGEAFDRLQKKLLITSKPQDPSEDQLKQLTNLYGQQKYQKAIEKVDDLIKLFPASAILHNIRGASLKGQGRHEFAIEAFKNAIAIEPDNASCYNNLGVCFLDQGSVPEAIQAFEKAIAIKPRFAEAYNNIGTALADQEKLHRAIRAFKEALTIKPAFAEVYNNIGIALTKQMKTEEAIAAFNSAVTINPNYTEAYINMGNALKGVNFNSYEDWIEAAVLEILKSKTMTRPSDIVGSVLSLIKYKPKIKSHLKLEFSEISNAQFEKIALDLCDTPILLKLMEVCPLPDPELERFLTSICSYILQNISKINVSPEMLKIQSALALQCFTNEYIYNLNEGDTEALSLMENSVKDELMKGNEPSPHEVLCLASYRALNGYEWHGQLRSNHNIAEVFQRQITEPEEERKIRSHIKKLGKISNKISKKVKGQYEVNPYPRWVNLGLVYQPVGISEIVKRLELDVTESSVAKVQAPEILIAGCGTGQHAIGTAYCFKDSKVVAVDLSLASLAYAMRKTDELGVKNIEYMQADILNLGKLGKQFDIVECAGVLHHMDDPMAGWKVLTDCLKPGGLMKIGLYSEMSRQEIVKIREEITNQGITTNDNEVRSFRSKLMLSSQDQHKNILNSSDFYSSSNLIDLLFHVQEHRFTIPQLKDCLSELGLKFCGFEGGKLVSQFKLTETKKDSLYNLDRWHEYEQFNPKTFASMYQFWCQKMES